MKKWILIIVIIAVGYFVFTKKYYPSGSACVEYSKNQVGNKTYKNLQNQIRDSVSNWIKNKLMYFATRNKNNTLIDSILCFNNQGDKLITALLNNSYNNSIDWFYGVKIKNKWYFFQGPQIVLLERYLPFSKLHELAEEHIFRGYLHQSLFDKIFRPNHWNINEEFFEQLDDGAYNTPGISKQEYEESWLRLNKENWSKIDTTNYD